MQILKSFMIIAVLALYSMGAVAQSEYYDQEKMDAATQKLGYAPYPYGFVQVQGGVGTTFTDMSCWKLLTPTFSVAAGYMFTPVIGARLHLNGYQSKGGFDTMGQYYEGLTVSEPSNGVWALTGDPMTYKYNYINTNFDLMLNLVNIFSKRVHHPLDLYLIGGVGCTYAWNNDDVESLTSRYNVGSNLFNVWDNVSYNLRLGLLADCNISKHLSLGLEVDFNALDDRFNSKFEDSDDWMMTAQLSLTYKFGFSKTKKKIPETPLYQEVKQPEPVVEPAPTPVVEEPKPVEEPVKEVKIEPVKENIFYAIRETNLKDENVVDRIAEWCKTYPNKTITISGYADKGTGNAKINAKYAKLRADKMAAALQDKGVPASQMIVNSYGDTIQPFAKNEDNRCVIIESK